MRCFTRAPSLMLVPTTARALPSALLTLLLAAGPAGAGERVPPDWVAALSPESLDLAERHQRSSQEQDRKLSAVEAHAKQAMRTVCSGCGRPLAQSSLKVWRDANGDAFGADEKRWPSLAELDHEPEPEPQE